MTEDTKALAIERFRTAALAPIVYVVVKSVARSGMSRRMEFYAQAKGGLVRLTCYMAQITGWRLNDTGLLVQGCGMDMGFHAFDTAMAVAFGRDSKEYERWQLSTQRVYL